MLRGRRMDELAPGRLLLFGGRDCLPPCGRVGGVVRREPPARAQPVVEFGGRRSGGPGPLRPERGRGPPGLERHPRDVRGSPADPGRGLLGRNPARRPARRRGAARGPEPQSRAARGAAVGAPGRRREARRGARRRRRPRRARPRDGGRRHHRPPRRTDRRVGAGRSVCPCARRRARLRPESERSLRISGEDALLLSAIAQPGAVCPDLRLRRTAADLGWPVLDS